ncbi:hypothetical protein [Streptomyces sp. NPDC005345]|uniref:hypothetical protein n=1 Tax=Streptomyces sp. NPDC005345 TaxID=3156877 RepID=UPI00339E9FF9
MNAFGRKTASHSTLNCHRREQPCQGPPTGFGACHAGTVGVVLDDGTVPRPVHLDASSSGGGRAVSQWTVYDGRPRQGPRAVALRAVCSCGWHGPEERLDWEEIGDQDLQAAEVGAAEICMRDWDEHAVEVERSAVPLPEAVTGLPAQLEVEKPAKSSPLAAIRAARRREVLAAQSAYRSTEVRAGAFAR